MKPWEKVEVDDPTMYVSMDRWGKDHWSTLAYAETRAVDGKGVLSNQKMRTDPRLHRRLVGITFGHIQDGSKYPTRLKDGEMEKHDDWSCLEDAIAEGLIEVWTGRRKGSDNDFFGCEEAKVKFTKRGLTVIAELREHKSNGGSFSNFTPKSVVSNYAG